MAQTLLGGGGIGRRVARAAGGVLLRSAWRSYGGQAKENTTRHFLRRGRRLKTKSVSENSEAAASNEENTVDSGGGTPALQGGRRATRNARNGDFLEGRALGWANWRTRVMFSRPFGTYAIQIHPSALKRRAIVRMSLRDKDTRGA
jgi:hypothetical protein